MSAADRGAVTELAEPEVRVWRRRRTAVITTAPAISGTAPTARPDDVERHVDGHAALDFAYQWRRCDTAECAHRRRDPPDLQARSGGRRRDRLRPGHGDQRRGAQRHGGADRGRHGSRAGEHDTPAVSGTPQEGRPSTHPTAPGGHHAAASRTSGNAVTRRGPTAPHPGVMAESYSARAPTSQQDPLERDHEQQFGLERPSPGRRPRSWRASAIAAVDDPPVTAGLQLWYDDSDFDRRRRRSHWPDKSGTPRPEAFDPGRRRDARNAINGRDALEFNGTTSL